jgi:hypothetical protein
VLAEAAVGGCEGAWLLFLLRQAGQELLLAHVPAPRRPGPTAPLLMQAPGQTDLRVPVARDRYKYGRRGLTSKGIFRSQAEMLTSIRCRECKSRHFSGLPRTAPCSGCTGLPANQNKHQVTVSSHHQ